MPNENMKCVGTQTPCEVQWSTFLDIQSDIMIVIDDASSLNEKVIATNNATADDIGCCT